MLHSASSVYLLFLKGILLLDLFPGPILLAMRNTVGQLEGPSAKGIDLLMKEKTGQVDSKIQERHRRAMGRGTSQLGGLVV